MVFIWGNNGHIWFGTEGGVSEFNGSQFNHYSVEQGLVNNRVDDLFEDKAFSIARKESLQYASMLRRMGEFEPARLSLEEMEYTTMPQVLERLGKRFFPLTEEIVPDIPCV